MSNMYKKYLDKAKKQKPKEKQEKEFTDLYKKYNLKYANGTPSVGMGDVKTADASNNQLPVLQQGYGGEDNDKIAQILSKIEARAQGKNPGTQSPEDVKNAANAIALAAPNELGVVEEGANAGKDALEAADALDTTNDASEGALQKFKQFLNISNKSKLPAAGTGGGLSAAEQAALKPNYSIPQEQVANNLSKPSVMLQDSNAPIPNGSLLPEDLAKHLAENAGHDTMILGKKASPGPQFKNQGGIIKHYDMGTPSVPMSSSSANTASSLSPLLKNTYASKKMHKYSDGTPQVEESQQDRYQAKDYFGKNDGSDSGETLGRFSDGGPIYPEGQYKNEDFSAKGLNKFAGGVKHYDEGTPAASPDVVEMFRNWYKAKPSPTPTPEEDRKARNAKIREDAAQQFGHSSAGYNEGTDDVEDNKQSKEESSIEYAEDKKRKLEKDLLDSKPKDREPENAMEYNNPDKFPGVSRPKSNAELNNPDKYNKGTIDASPKTLPVKPSTNPGNRSQAMKNTERSPFHFDDGTVSAPTPPIDPNAAQSAQDSMRKAFHFARGTTHVPEHEAYHKYMALFGGLPKVPTILKNPLTAVKAPATVKIPLNIERAPHLKIPKRLKSISSIKGYAEGTDDAEEKIVDDSNDAMIQKYRKLGMLKGPTVKTKDVANIKASPTSQDDESQLVDQGPYPGEEPAAQDVVDNSAQGQVQKLIDDHDKSQDVLQQIDKALGKSADDSKYPKIKNVLASKEDNNDDEEPKVLANGQIDIPNWAKKDKNAPSPALESKEDQDLEDQYNKEENEADKASPEDNEEEKEPSKDLDQIENAKKVLKEQPQEDDNNPAKRLLAAQQQQRNATLFNTLGAITDKMGASMGHFKPQNQEIYEQNIKNADLPVKQLEQQMAMEKFDPNSKTSQSFRQYLAKFGGQDVEALGNISAAQAEAIAPMAFKQFEAQQAQKARSTDMAARSAERLAQAKLIAEQRAETARDHNDLMREMAADKAVASAETKKEKDAANQEKQQASVAKNVDQALYGFRQPPDVKQARMDFLNANKGLDTIAAYEKMPGGTDSMDPQMVGNLRDEVQKIAQSGAPTEGGINKFDPRTWSGDLSTAWQKVINKPTGANAGQFIKKYKDYFNTMQETTGGLVNSYNNSILKNNKKHMSSEDYDDRANSEYVAPYLKYNKAPKAEASSQQNSTTPQGKTVVRKGYNPKTNQTQLIYDDGTKEIVDGRQ